MALKVNYKNAMKDAYQQAERIEKALLNQLIKAGENFVTRARLDVKIDESAFPSQHPGKGTGVYIDRTKNLRNSIGYVIYKNGAPVRENFEGAGEGSSAAKSELSKIQKKSGYVLIVIAGMNYASYVESLGYNVITSQSFIMISDLLKGMERLEKKTGAQIAAEVQGISSVLKS